MRYGLILILAASLHAATVVRVVCGGPGGTDAAGNVWAADSGIGGGIAWTAANQPNLSSQPIPYQSMCYSVGTASFSRTFNVPAGNYTVKFKFLEPNKTAAGQRLFGASINGVPVISGLDLFAAAGALKPYDLAFNTTAVNGSIQIIFTTSLWKSVISAIQIDSLPTIPPDKLSQCTGSGFSPADPHNSAWSATSTYAAGSPVNFGGFSWFSLQSANVGQQPDTSSLWWKQLSWDCAGMLWGQFGMLDGSIVSVVGTQMNPPVNGSIIWAPYVQPTQTAAATNTQAVIAYNAPDANPCTVEVSESPTMRPLVNDTNPALFAAAGISTGGAGPRFFLSASEYTKKASTVTFIRLHCKPISSTSSASLAAHK